MGFTPGQHPSVSQKLPSILISMPLSLPGLVGYSGLDSGGHVQAGLCQLAAGSSWPHNLNP